MQDKVITCRDCGDEFVFTAGEQEFYAEKGFSEPTRCGGCRAARKASRREGSHSSGSFSRSREMYPAVCAQCGKQTEVPFEPRGDRPVYCPECFAAQRGDNGGGRDRRGGRGRGRGRSDSRNSDRYDDRW